MISLLLPSRGRPTRFADTYRSIVETAAERFEIVVVLDADDPTRLLYPNLGRDGFYLLSPRDAVHSDLWNVAYRQSSGDLVMLCADDLIFRSRGWDTAVAGAFSGFPDQILHVWCNDGTPHTHVATHPFVSRRWVDTVGFFTPPYFPVWYADTWLLDLGIKLRRQMFLKDVVIEHQHPTYGTAPLDETYELAVSKRPTSQDNWKRRAPERLEQAQRLLAVMDPDLRSDPGLDHIYQQWGHPLERV